MESAQGGTSESKIDLLNAKKEEKEKLLNEK
jgi:hypothetical protein